jgi:hypothetical protein
LEAESVRTDEVAPAAFSDAKRHVAQKKQADIAVASQPAASADRVKKPRKKRKKAKKTHS